MTQQSPVTDTDIPNKSPKQINEELMDVMPVQPIHAKEEYSTDALFLQYEKELEQPLMPIKLWHKITFIFLGIASLAGWNAILMAMSFFKNKYPEGKFLAVDFYFGIPIMTSNFLASFACPAIARRFNYNQRIAYCLIGVCFLMNLVTIIAIFFNTIAGFWITLILLFIQGFIDSVNTNSLIALAGMVHPTINRIYWTCTALSGLTMNIIKYIVLGIFSGQYENESSAIYFSFAGIIYVVSSIMQIVFTKSDFFQLIERRSFMRNQLENRKQIDTKKMINGNCQKIQAEPNGFEQEEGKTKKSFSFKELSLFKYILYLLQVYKYTGFVPIYLILIYIQTFMVFPGVSVFKKTTYKLLESPFDTTFMLLLFNLGDLIGKYTGIIKALLKLYFVYGVVLSRFIMVVIFVLIQRCKEDENLQNDVFSWFCMFMFALTNGFATTALMNLGTRKAQDPKIIDLINYIGGFAITLGINIGALLALSFT